MGRYRPENVCCSNNVSKILNNYKTNRAGADVGPGIMVINLYFPAAQTSPDVINNKELKILLICTYLRTPQLGAPKQQGLLFRLSSIAAQMAPSVRTCWWVRASSG